MYNFIILTLTIYEKVYLQFVYSYYFHVFFFFAEFDKYRYRSTSNQLCSSTVGWSINTK